MLGFPASTEFGKRIPKQKFYENLDVSPALHRMFVDQIKLVYWRNKLAASTLNTRKQRPSSARASASAPKSWRRSKRSSAAFRRTSCGRRCALPTGWIIGTKRTASRISAPRRSPATKTASACTSSRSWARFR